jgi:hypothetical protein
MSNKFSTANKIKAPYVCKKRPLFPIPPLSPSGTLLLAYEYWLDDGEGRRITGAGQLMLQPITDNEWCFDPGYHASGVPCAMMFYNDVEKTALMSYEIYIEDDWGVLYQSDNIADPITPPWSWSAELIASHSDAWPGTYAHGQLMML